MHDREICLIFHILQDASLCLMLALLPLIALKQQCWLNIKVAFGLTWTLRGFSLFIFSPEVGVFFIHMKR